MRSPRRTPEPLPDPSVPTNPEPGDRRVSLRVAEAHDLRIDRGRRRRAPTEDPRAGRGEWGAALVHRVRGPLRGRFGRGGPVLHAYRSWRRRLVVFEEVDVDVIIERSVSGAAMGTRHIVRAANEMSVDEIDSDLRSARRREMRRRDHPGWTAIPLPARVRPQRAVADRRPVSPGREARGRNRVGDVDRDVRRGRSLTLSFDHDIVNGVPAARFAKRLKEKIERGDGIQARA